MAAWYHIWHEARSLEAAWRPCSLPPLSSTQERSRERESSALWGRQGGALKRESSVREGKRDQVSERARYTDATLCCDVLDPCGRTLSLQYWCCGCCAPFTASLDGKRIPVLS